jgi:LmbE family N-acetylglucosaminyl deacetylase
MLQETDLVPYTVSFPKGNKVLILSPHPDDETLGCGGTIRLLLLKKIPVKVIFLTSGDKADPSDPAANTRHHEEHFSDYALMREKEAVKALSVLGVSDYEFFRFPDRELHVHYRDVFDRILKVVETFMPDTIYSPSVVELNPDHRATAALSLEIQRVITGRKECQPIKLMFYEVTIPLRPNMLVDVTSVYPTKKRSIKKYKSQLKISDYLRYITALNSFRALTVKGPRLVEAFWFIEGQLNEGDMTQWLGYRDASYKIW